VPGSSATTNTSTGPSSSLVPETQVAVAHGRSPATTAKSVTDHPGLIGHGRYVGNPSAAPRWSANAS
jgi:hypothetical protein